MLGVYTDNSVSNLIDVASQHDGTNGSQTSFNTVAGTTYHIALAGWAQTYGEFDLQLLQVLTPTLTAVNLLPAGFAFQVQGTPGVAYVIEASTNLTTWVPVATNAAVFTHLDTDVAGFPQRFFRARSSP